MTRPRAALVALADTPFYHCTNRCVRQAFLCGVDAISGRSFEHRRNWLLERLELLTHTFAIELCAYALMSNHYHLVVYLHPARAATWSAYEVAVRWRRFFRGPPWLERYLQHQPLAPGELAQLDVLVPLWTERLCSLSWFERCLNEYLARRANAEDGCTGHFWEGRFKSEALLDDPAVLAAMVYVDLNPVRAGVAASLPESDFTSVQQRLREISATAASTREQRPLLRAFAGDRPQVGATDTLPFHLQDYLDLADLTGRVARADKPGVIAPTAPALLTSLGIAPTEWFATVTQIRRRYQSFIGAPRRLRQLANDRGWHWVRGLSAGRRFYCHANE